MSCARPAFIDGCSNTRFFFMFVIPLSKAIIAVISLYIAVAHWNNYYNALVYTTDASLQPLQLYLRHLLLMTTGTESIIWNRTPTPRCCAWYRPCATR